MTMHVGDILGGKYRLKRLRGKGGMGAVYEAEHVVLGKAFAIKLLHPHYAMQPEVFKRFQLEAQAAAGIGHRGIVDVYDIGQTDDGAPFLVMELLHGESLAGLLDRNRQLDVTVAVEIVAQTLSALVAVHKKKILHRDLKPENIFLCQEDDLTWSIKILDFGISKVTGPEDMHLTMTGSVLGTAHYMSPEQARGAKDVDLRADIWAVGAIFFRALAGHLPFEGDSYNEVLAKILSDPVISPRTKRPEISETLDLILLQALAKNRDERYANASDFLEDLGEFRAERGETPSPWNGPIPRDVEDDKVTKGPGDVRPNGGRYYDLEDSKPTAAFDVESMNGVESPVLDDSKASTPIPMAVQRSQSVIPETCMIPTEHWRDPKPPWEKPPSRPDTFDAAVKATPRFDLGQRLLMAAMIILGFGAIVGVGWATWPSQGGSQSDGNGEVIGIIATAQPESSSATLAPSDQVVDLDSQGTASETEPEIAASLQPAIGTEGHDLDTESSPPTEESSEEGNEVTPSNAPAPRSSTRRHRPLSRREISSALGSRQSRLRRCLGLRNQTPTLVRVRVRISTTGAVSYESASPSPPLNVSSCFREAVRGARVGSGGTEPTNHVISVRASRRREPVKRNGPLWDSPFG